MYILIFTIVFSNSVTTDQLYFDSLGQCKMYEADMQHDISFDSSVISFNSKCLETR